MSSGWGWKQFLSSLKCLPALKIGYTFITLFSQVSVKE